MVLSKSGSLGQVAGQVGPRQLVEILKRWYENRSILGLRTPFLPFKWAL
jgi:hypothetical protein